MSIIHAFYLSIVIAFLRSLARKLLSPGRPRGGTPLYTIIAHPMGDPFTICRIADVYSDISPRKLLVETSLAEFLDRARVYADMPHASLASLPSSNSRDLSSGTNIGLFTSVLSADYVWEIRNILATVIPRDEFRMR